MARIRKMPVDSPTLSFSHAREGSASQENKIRVLLTKEGAMIAREAKSVMFSTPVLSNFNVHTCGLRILLKCKF